MMRQFTLIIFITLAFASQSLAQQFQVDYWVGSGPDTAYLVIDFQDGQSPSSFVWGYLFEDADSIDGKSFFNEVSIADPALQPVYSGGFLDQIIYKTHDQSNENPYFWSYTQFVDGEWNGDYWEVEKLLSNGVYGFNYADWQNPVDPTLPPAAAQHFTMEDVKFWIGEGDQEAVFIVDFNDSTDVEAFAWGYRFTEADSIDGSKLLSDIDDADASLEVIGAFIDQVKYEMHSQVSSEPFYWLLYENEGQGTSWVSSFWTSAKIHDGNWYAINFTSWQSPVNPGEPLPVEESVVPFFLPFDDLDYWVGEGSDSVMVVIDFVDGEQSTFAWGVRFEDSIQFESALQLIVEADDSLEVNLTTLSTDYLDYSGAAPLTILQLEDTTWASLQGLDWMKNQSVGALVFKEIAISASYPIPALEHKFAPAAGEPGSTAISHDSSVFVNWAVGVSELVRGYIDISDTLAEDEGSNRASFGTENEAIGKANGVGTEVVSLGDGGSITLTFEHHIYNGEGPDFAVFENGFGPTFLEFAFVEVSSDGANYFRFPAISLASTLEQTTAFGESDPRDFYNLAGKYQAGYGVPFDLEELEGIFGLDVNAIQYVRIIDVVGSLDPMYATLDSKGTIINDPFTSAFKSGGFDLDGVGVIHEDPATGIFEESNVVDLGLFPNPVHNRLVCDFKTDLNDNLKLAVCNSLGEVLYKQELGVLSAGSHRLDLDISSLQLSNGILFVSVTGDHTKFVSSVFKD